MRIGKVIAVMLVMVVVFMGSVAASASVVHSQRGQAPTSTFVSNMIGIQQQMSKAPME